MTQRLGVLLRRTWRSSAPCTPASTTPGWGLGTP